jgi:signal transduction histidine kinase
MNYGIKLRLIGFVLAISLLVSLIVWTARTSWRRIGELREKLTAVQLESFRIADHFQQTLLGLNNVLLQYQIQRDPADLAEFNRESAALDHWIDVQRPMLKTVQERLVLDHINAAYDDYIAAARLVEGRASSDAGQNAPLIEFANFQKQSDRLINLGYTLAKAHRESLDDFLAQSNQSLGHLRTLLSASLFVLLAFGAGLAVVVYREMIAPLRVRLVESQALIERQEKLASLGMLAAGVAHEIRNPLTAIKARLFTQQKLLKPGTPTHDDAVVIGREIDRLERIVKDFLLFARPSEPHLTSLPADEPLREVQALLAPHLERANIKLRLENCPDARVRIDLQQMKQVLINLVQNAAESIGRDGSIILRTRLDSIRLAERPTNVVILEVADTGKGISPEVEKRLFDPFFSTKDGGTGLGLSIAARIVQRHGGALQYQTKVQRGAIFGIVLPRLEPDDSAAQDSAH